MDIFKTIFVGLALALLIVSSMLAQDNDDDEIEWVEFESEFGLVTFSYPENWFVVDLGDLEEPTTYTAIAFGNHEDFFEDREDEAITIAGEKSGLIVAFPVDVMNLSGLEIDSDTSPEQLTEAMSEIIRSADEYYEWGELEVIQIEGHPDLGIVPITSEMYALEGLFFTFYKNEVVVYGMATAYTGEFDEEYRDLAIEMILTYGISVDGEELFEIMTDQ